VSEYGGRKGFVNCLGKERKEEEREKMFQNGYRRRFTAGRIPRGERGCVSSLTWGGGM